MLLTTDSPKHVVRENNNNNQQSSPLYTIFFEKHLKNYPTIAHIIYQRLLKGRLKSRLSYGTAWNRELKRGGVLAAGLKK